MSKLKGPIQKANGRKNGPKISIPATMDEIFGSKDPQSKFGATNLEEFQAKITGMYASELSEYCLRFGIKSGDLNDRDQRKRVVEKLTYEFCRFIGSADSVTKQIEYNKKSENLDLRELQKMMKDSQ